MEDFIMNENLMFEDAQLDKMIQNLNEIFKKKQNNFAELCCCVAKIYYYCKENAYKSKDDVYYNAYNLLARFGFDKNAVSRMVRCYEKFIRVENESIAGDTKLDSVFFLFSSSKLFELLTVSTSQLLSDIEKEILKPTMTKAEIREYVKNLNKPSQEIDEDKNKDEEDIDEDDDDEFFNPNKHYDMSFFEGCNQKQLVGIAWTLQYELEKFINKRGN